MARVATAGNESEPHIIPLPDRHADLSTVLEAWREATTRLQQTHETLRDEVRRLSDELETKNRALARRNRLADLGQMAAHVAHEVRNCIVPMTLYLSLLRRQVVGDQAALGTVEKIESGFTALEATVSDLLSFTANRDPAWQSFNLRQFVTELTESLAPQITAQNIELEIDVPAATVVVADRDMLRRAVLNLVLNAIDAMPAGGELVVTGWSGNGCFELEVADSGPGIEREQSKQLFEPFYTTKSEGTGLGLAIVQRIAEVHGGRATATNCAEGGAAFTISIPQRLMEAAA